jgi:hypothetical protein
MKIFKYNVGTIVDNDGKETKIAMSGVIEIEVPTYKERLTLIKTLGFNDETKKDKSFDSCLELVDIVEKRVKSVNVSIEKSADKITNLEDLGYYKEGAEIINDIGRLIISGFGVGKL